MTEVSYAGLIVHKLAQPHRKVNDEQSLHAGVCDFR